MGRDDRRFLTRTSPSIIGSRDRSSESPDSIALVWGEESLTYRDFNRLANSLAHRLVELGVKPETVVGLYLEQWPSRVIGLLGVLKAGGAYLPLDPDHPVDRVAAMLQDSGATVLVTEDHLPRPAAGCLVPGRHAR